MCVLILSAPKGVGEVQGKAARVVRGMGWLPHNCLLRRLDLFFLERRLKR